MTSLWFYRPRTMVSRMRCRLRGATWEHVGIVHAVIDVMVLTQSHPSKGAWCTPLSRVEKPDFSIELDNIEDIWVTRWLIQRWGVKFGWLDRVLNAVPGAHSVRDAHVRSSVLASYLLLDAAQSGFEIPMKPGASISDPNKVIPDSLAACLLVPK